MADEPPMPEPSVPYDVWGHAPSTVTIPREHRHYWVQLDTGPDDATPAQNPTYWCAVCGEIARKPFVITIRPPWWPL